MADFQTDVLDHIARVVGGTVSSSFTHWFSGAEAGDGSGVSGLKGCWSQAPNIITQTPVALVEAGPFTAELLGGQGKEGNEDQVKIIVLVAKYDLKSQIGVLTPYRDSIPAAFRSHMQAFAAPDVLDAFITAGTPGIRGWGGLEYLAWEFTCRVRRHLSVLYAA